MGKNNNILFSLIFLIIGYLMLFFFSRIMSVTLSKKTLVLCFFVMLFFIVNILFLVNKKNNKKRIFDFILINFLFFLIFFSFLTAIVYIFRSHYFPAVTISFVFSCIFCFAVQKSRINKLQLFNGKIIALLILELFLTIFLMRFLLKYCNMYTFLIDMLLCIIVYVLNLSLFVIFDSDRYFWNIIKDKYRKIVLIWNKIIDTKILKRIFLFFPKNIIVFLLFIISIFTFLKFYNGTNDYYSLYSQSIIDDNIGPIKEKYKVDVNFISDVGDISVMCFRFATFRRINDTYMTVKIENDNKTFFREKFNTKNLGDGEIKCFNIGKMTLDELKGSDIYLIPSGNLSDTNAITVFKDSKTGNLAISLAKIQKDDIKIIKFFIIVLAFILYFVVNYIVNKKKIGVNKYFLLCLVFFVPMAFIIPPYQVPDEAFHFFKSYSLSRWDVGENVSEVVNNEEMLVPSNISCLNYSNLVGADRVYTASDVFSCFEGHENVDYNNGYNGYKSFFGYLPQAIGIKIADLFSNSPLIIFYGGRLFSLLFSMLIIYYAIRITPRYKNLFLIVSTMMMFVQEMVSYSYDSVLNAISILFIAILLKIIYSDKKISIKSILVLIAILIAIINIKAIYFSLALLLFLIPKERFKNDSILIKYLSVIAVIGFAVFISYFLNNYFSMYNVNVIDESNISQLQINYLVHHPLSIPTIIFNTFDIQFVFYLRSIVGYFSYFKFAVNDIYILVYFLLFLYVLSGEKNNSSFKEKSLLLLSFLIASAGIFVSMYLYSSVYASNFVAGVQGRYFFPILIPFTILFIKKNKILQVDNYNIYMVVNVLLLQMMLVFAIWYY